MSTPTPAAVAADLTAPTAVPATPVPIPPLEVVRVARVRYAVRAVLALGVTASVAANVLAARPDLVGRVVAAWPPVALLLTIELMARIPVTRFWLASLRVLAAASVAGIAAWASYWHMVTVASRVGESTTSAHLVPLSVDGMVVVASVCLVELADRAHHLTTARTAPGEVAGSTSPAAAATAPAVPAVPAASGEPGAIRPANPRRAARTTPTGTSTGRGGDTGAAVRRLRERHPDWTVGQIAARAGISDRQARRHLNPTSTSTSGAPELSAARAGEASEVAA